QAGAEHLYGFLREFQKTPYCAFLRGGGREVLSFSPELFFERDGDHICVQPMKGTAARGALAGLDEERSQLAADEKNRAENVMIVDLLRNDLGRIAKTGSVRVESLFDVETHPTLHQMTSRIRAELGPEVTYQKIFEAIFPSGSVTGAPKVRTMQIIDGLERGGRGVYCGAIGYISPQKKAVFSVPIRILQRAAGETDWQYRVGSGIVWDSDPRSEWEEAHLKTKFLTQGAPKDFQLIETMLWENGRLLWRDEHLKRLEASARCFGFSMDGGILEKLEEFLRQLPGASQRVRLLCSRDGTIELQASLLAAWAREREVLVGVSEVRLDPENIFLRHKTTCRPWYQMTMERIAGKDVFDDVFFNSKGQLCEGAITNVFVEINGCLYTPPVECGLLPGILRQQLLKEGRCRERLISREEFLGAQRFYVGNSVRGLLPARLKKADRR
ncbi:MAG TPA: chorismate-binding protein, partial [Candidatus Omnitrophota bacterium]|nr:chorismate-binding protein [Candidatus Omnitrophota bacterium]